MASNGSGGDLSPKNSKQTLGGYELLDKVGQGAMGAVFKARQVSINRIVALKVLPQRLAKNAEFVARFLREAQSAARLNHANIVQAYDAGQADGYYYFAMEFIDGPGLDALLHTTGALSEQRALEITRDIVRALETAHNAGIIHRDVKPANILLTPDGAAKLADLGLARESAVGRDNNLTNVGIALGTPDYMSPEQVRGEANIDGRCDMYSLGATLYHLLVGSPPYAGGTPTEIMSKHLTEPVPNPRRANADISTAAAAIIKKAMAKNRDARYASASEMLAAIEAALKRERLTVTARPPRTPTRARQSTGKTLLHIGSAAAAVGLLALCVVLFGGLKDGSNGQSEAEQAARDARAKAVEADNARLTSLRAWAGRHPGEYVDTISRYRDAIGRMTTPAARLKAGNDLRALRSKLGDAAKAAFAPVKERSEALAMKGDYDGALALFDKLPAQFASVLADSVGRAKERLKAEAVIKVKTVLDEARKLGADDKYDEALAQLKQLDGLRYAAALPRIRDIRAKLLADQVRARETAGRARQQRVLSEFRAELPAALKTHQFEALATRLDGLIADPTLNTIRKETEADRRVVGKLAALLRRVRSNAQAEAGKTVKTTLRWKGIPATVQAYNAETDTVRFNRGEQTIADMRAADVKALLDLNPGPANEYHEPLALLFIAEGEPEDARTHAEQASDRTSIGHLRKVLGRVGVVTAEPVEKPTPPEQEASLAMWKKSQALYREYCGHLEKKRLRAREVCRQAAEAEVNKIKGKINGFVNEAASLHSKARRTSPAYRAEKLVRQAKEKQQAADALTMTLPRVGKKARAALKLIDKKATVKKRDLRAVLLRHKTALDLGRTFTEKQMRAAYERMVPAEPGEEGGGAAGGDQPRENNPMRPPAPINR